MGPPTLPLTLRSPYPRVMKITLLALLVLLPAASRAQTSSLTQLLSLSGTDAAVGEAMVKDIDKGLKEKVAAETAERPLFQITEKDMEGKKRRFMVIHLAQLGKPYLFTSTIERGTSDGSLLSTMMDATFLIVFKQTGDKIVVARRQTAYRAAPGSAESRAIDQSVADQILAILPIMPPEAKKDEKKPEEKPAEPAKPEPPSYVVIPADALFLGDVTQLAGDLKMMNGPQRMTAYRADMSSVEKLTSFPKNTEARVHLVFTMGNPDTILSATVRYSITDLPENKGFESRPADPRVGYFTTSFQNLGRADMKHKTEPVEHMINRWDLRKKDPNAAVSEVEKPVVFWLEDTIPEDYRGAIRAGILSWNRAFEAAGLKGAIEVKEVDKDLTAEQRASFDPADISYNMVRWFVGEGSAFAIGPSRVNPMTGQILNASVSVGDMITRVVTGDLDLVGGQDASKGSHKHTAACRHDETLRHSAMGLRLLQGQPGVTPAEIERYQYEFVLELMAHEIGHNLGLRHNFKGSNAAAKSGSGLHSTSVMDYLPASIAGKGETQGAYYQTEVGAYDKWAIEYGYASLSGDKKKALQTIAGRSGSDPLLAYGTDEDADRLDPDTQRWDSGADPLKGAKKQVALAKDLLKRLETDAQAPDHDSAQLKERYWAGFGAYFQATRQLLPLIGGMRSQRGVTSKFTPVSAAEQREALKFLETEIFAKDALKTSPKLLLSMGDDQTGYSSSSPVNPTSLMSALQTTALGKLYSPATLKRLSDGELYVAEAGGSLTVSEMTQRVRAAVWSEIQRTKPVPEDISLTRRNLQSQHLGLLMGVAKGSPVIDAKAAARRDLEVIKRDLTRAIPLAKEGASKLHLQEMLRQATEALENKD